MATLKRHDLGPDPFEQFEQWLTEAIAEPSVIQPYAMTLATASQDNIPSARTVLLRGVDQRGFVFYTNYESQKGQELKANPQAALTFYWASLNRQIRIGGSIAQIAEVESDAYFHSRPRGSQLGAWASQQSQIIKNRDVLEKQLQELAIEYASQPVPRPSFWGGYRLTPIHIDFWQSGENRLHDWFRYHRVADEWRLERLSP